MLFVTLQSVNIRGGMGTRRLNGSGRVLHYPALSGPGRYGPDPGTRDATVLCFKERRSLDEVQHCILLVDNLDGSLPQDGISSHPTRRHLAVIGLWTD